MIRIAIAKDSHNSLCSIKAQGHSGYQKRGRDIVCAAVSSLMQALAVGVLDVLKLKSVVVDIDESKAVMGYSWNPLEDTRVSVISETIYLSLKGIAAAYSNYVVIIEEEKR